MRQPHVRTRTARTPLKYISSHTRLDSIYSYSQEYNSLEENTSNIIIIRQISICAAQLVGSRASLAVLLDVYNSVFEDVYEPVTIFVDLHHKKNEH